MITHKIAFLILLGLLVADLQAQNPVLKQVVIWGRTDESKQGDKRLERFYDTFGRLISEEKKPDQEDFAYLIKSNFQYDEQGRLQYEARLDGEEEIFVKYAYNGDTTTIKTEYKDFTATKYIRYHNYSHKPLEIKIYHGEFPVEKYTYQYDEYDSLTLETFYDYNLTADKKPVIKVRKTEYTYHLESRKRNMKYEYNFENLPIAETRYEYLADGNLSEEDGIGKSRRYEYQQGKLWIITDQEKEKKEESVYKNGKIIRKKFFTNDQLTYVMEYDYIYY